VPIWHGFDGKERAQMSVMARYPGIIYSLNFSFFFCLGLFYLNTIQTSIKMCKVSNEAASNIEGVFVVVYFFSSDKTYEVVPRKWISDATKTCGFPEIPPKGFKKLQSNADSEAENSWPTFDITIIKS